METLIILKVYPINDGKRGYKPVSQHKLLSVNDAQNYIREKELVAYDLIVNNKVLDRDGRGCPEKKLRKVKQPAIIFIDCINCDKLISFLEKDSSVPVKAWYELKKNSGMLAITLINREDALKMYAYLNTNADFKVLETVKTTLQISFETLTSRFNEKKQWQNKELPKQNILRFGTDSELSNYYTFEQILNGIT